MLMAMIAVEEFTITEIAKPADDPEAAEQVARFVLRDLYRKPEPDTDRVARQLNFMTHMITLAAFEGERVAATGSLLIRPGQTTLEDIVVAKDLRRDGRGSRMAEALEARAVAEGVDRIDIFPALTAELFYERLGYRLAEPPESSDAAEPLHKQYYKLVA